MLLGGFQHDLLTTQGTFVFVVALETDHTADAKDVVAAETDGFVGDHGADGTEVVVELGDYC